MEYEGHRLRHELKYYINEKNYDILRGRLRQVMSRDENMESDEGYLITSLYFDDAYESAMEEKLAGARFRRKYRIRVYDRSDSVIKLECKLKYDVLIAKESAPLTREEYDSLLNGGYEFLLQRNEEVCRDLYLLHRTRGLRPTVVVEYLREAYTARFGNVRITFDKKIAASLDTLDMLGDSCPVTEALAAGTMVLEVKYDDYLPAWIWKLIQLPESDRCAISKYVMCRHRNVTFRHH